MAMEYEFTAIATLRMLVKGTVLNKFGGLIFVKKTSQIFDLSDIVGKIVLLYPFNCAYSLMTQPS
jgi:hypothetical protein